MKRTTFAILFTILITLSCVFASCNMQGRPSGQNTDSGSASDTNSYSSLIKELEDQILELKQDQYISEAKRNEEILRLEAMIEKILQGSKFPTADSDNTEGPETDTEASTEEGRFIYEVENGTAILTGYTGNDKELTLPSFIDGYAVTAISDDAFVSDTLTAVIIPEGVTRIGWFAFKGCDALRSITIPKSVDDIGYSALPSRAVGFSVICSADSFAAKYAESYGISVTII